MIKRDSKMLMEWDQKGFPFFIIIFLKSEILVVAVRLFCRMSLLLSVCFPNTIETLNKTMDLTLSRLDTRVRTNCEAKSLENNHDKP